MTGESVCIYVGESGKAGEAVWRVNLYMQVNQVRQVKPYDG